VGALNSMFSLMWAGLRHTPALPLVAWGRCAFLPIFMLLRR